MKQYYAYEEGQLHMVFGVTEDNPWDEAARERFEHGNDRESLIEGYQFAQINLAGLNRPYERQGNMYIATAPGADMLFDGLTESRNSDGRRLVIRQSDRSRDRHPGRDAGAVLRRSGRRPLREHGDQRRP